MFSNAVINGSMTAISSVATVQQVACRVGLKPLVFQARAVLSLVVTHPSTCKAVPCLT